MKETLLVLDLDETLLYISGRTVQIKTFEPLVKVGAGREFTISKAH